MAWIQLSWQLTIPDPEEGSSGESPLCDEPTLQFAFVTAFGGVVRTHPYTTQNLFPGGFGVGIIGDIDPNPIGLVSSKNVPTAANPFLGFAARAIEQDNSGDNRPGDNRRFYDAVGTACQAEFDAGRIPTSTTLWVASDGARPTDDFGDDDDFIGTSARVFPTYGTDVAASLVGETEFPGGHPLPGSAVTFDMAFTQRRGADYRLACGIQLVANDPTGPLLVGELLAA